MSDLFAAALDKILTSACGPEVVAAAEREWPAALWNAVDASGIGNLGVRESRGGAGGGWAEIAPVLRTSARFAAPIPLAETIIARHLADRAELDLPDGPISVAIGDEVTLDARDRLSGPVRRVPWARNAAAMVLGLRRGDEVLVRIDRAQFSCTHGENLAREPRDTVVFDAVPVAIGNVSGVTGPRRAGAFARAAQISGALERVLELAIAHAAVREQFGRPIAKFQAVQDLIARLTAESAAATAVVDAAARAGAELRAVAAAKIRTATAASEGARLAHQIHGAIGVTHEHQLHNLTTRLWSWRDEFGTEARWARVLGERVGAEGATGFWEWLVSAGTEAA
jgi:acyl-CoA dehydrogenase